MEINLGDIVDFFRFIFGRKKKKNANNQVTVVNNKVENSNLDKVVTEILAQNYSQYEVKINETYTSNSPNVRVDYINIDKTLYLNGQRVAVIIYVRHNQDKLNVYKNLKQDCFNNNVKFINFFKQMPNKEEYVKERINSILN